MEQHLSPAKACKLKKQPKSDSNRILFVLLTLNTATNYLSTSWLGKIQSTTEDEEDVTPPPSPDTALHEETPDKYSVQDGQPQKFAEVSSQKFSKIHLDQAKIDFDISADLGFTVQQEALPHFPWLIFDPSKIPVTDEHFKCLRGSREKEMVTRINEGTHQQAVDNWTIDHVINQQWRDYFNILRTNFLTVDANSKNDAKIETMAEQLCHYFGFTVSRYYVLHQYPTFPVHVKANAPIEVKPDVVAGHWRFNPDKKMVCFFAEDSPMIDLLYKIIKANGWTPNASQVYVPNFIVECKSEDTETNDVCKLLIELAIIRDIEKRLFKKNRRYTLGAYCHGLNWRFYVLQDSDSPDFFYKAHHVCTHKLTKSYLTWLQLGVILQRLAAYNLSRTCRLELISEEEQIKLVDEIKELAVKSDMDRAKKRKRKQLKDDHYKKESSENDDSDDDDEHGGGKDERIELSNLSKDHVASSSTAAKSNPKPTPRSNVKDTKQRAWLEINDVAITRELYSGPSTRVCLAVTTSGYEVAVKFFESESEALYEAAMLRKLQGHYVVKLLWFNDAKRDKSRLILEKLSPLPDFTAHEQLQYFAWELLQALQYVHSKYCVHGDIKHANIMLSATNHVKLIDFAFAVTHYPGQTLKYKFGGTHVYMSPERLAGRFESNKIDIFAAGLVCAEKMYNTRIDSFATREKLIERTKCCDISGLATPELVDLVQSMLEVDPEKRPSAEVCLEHSYFGSINSAMDESE